MREPNLSLSANDEKAKNMQRLRGWVHIAWLAPVMGAVAFGIYRGALLRGAVTPLEPGRLGFQPNSDTRSTLNIVSECLATIFICVITAFKFGLYVVIYAVYFSFVKALPSLISGYH